MGRIFKAHFRLDDPVYIFLEYFYSSGSVEEKIRKLPNRCIFSQFGSYTTFAFLSAFYYKPNLQMMLTSGDFSIKKEISLLKNPTKFSWQEEKAVQNPISIT